MARNRWHGTLVIVLMGTLLFAPTAAADETVAAGRSVKAADDPKATLPSAEDVLKQMRNVRKERPASSLPIKVVEDDESTTGPAVSTKANYDSGTAPGMSKPKLRREGEFIPLRRGRIVRAPGGGKIMFLFDADSRSSPEPPMFIMPCQTLEDMERFIATRGDNIVFRVAGQVFVYRGANHLLPTIMKLAVDKGNLKQ